MLKKTIKFEDLDGNELTETFYFHMTETELTKLRMKYESRGGMQQYFAAIAKNKDVDALTRVFDDLVLGSVGIRSADGKRFEKRGGQIAEEFKETDAYSVLFLELLENDGRNFQAFIEAIIPNRSKGRLAEELSKQGLDTVTLPEPTPPPFKDVPHNPRPMVDPPKVTMEDLEETRVHLDAQIRAAVPPFVRENRPPTKEELLAMTPEQINAAFKRQ